MDLNELAAALDAEEFADVNRAPHWTTSPLCRMAVAVLNLQVVAASVSAEQVALLKRAVAQWHDPSFDGDDVKAVKDLFRSVFNIEHELSGCCIKNALLLERVEDTGSNEMFAVEIREDGSILWLQWEVEDKEWFEPEHTLGRALHLMVRGAVELLLLNAEEEV